MRRWLAGNDERRATLLVGAAMVASAAAILYLGRDLGFFSDELGWLTAGDDFSPETLLTPHNGQLIAMVRFAYEALPRAFGAEYLPFRLLELGALLGCAGLLFALARRRIGAAAAIPAILLLFFGSAESIMFLALGLPFTLSIGFGLAGLLAIEAEGPRRDALACGLLVLSVLSDTFGAIFAAGACIALARGPQRRRIWVAVVPLALYLAWWIWALRFDQDLASLGNAGAVPGFVIESGAAALAAVSGIGNTGFGADASTVERLLGLGFAALFAVLCLLLAIRARRHGAGRWLLAYVAILLAFWTGIALSGDEARQPDTPRYLFFDAVMIALIAAEATRGVRLARGAAIALALLAFLSLGANAVRLARAATTLTDQTEAAGAQVAMVELAGESAAPLFTPRSVAPRGSAQVAVPAVSLQAFAAEVGSPGLSLDEVREQPEAVREDADFVLARALQLIAVYPVRKSDGSNCRSIAEGAVRIPLPAGTVTLHPSGGAGNQPLVLGRFASEATVEVGRLGQGSGTGLAIPPDSAPEAWFADVQGPVRVCSARG